MKFDKFVEKLFRAKWSEAEQRHVGVIEEHPPTDTSNLYVIGTCEVCELLDTTSARVVCSIYVAAGRQKDFGCKYWEKKECQK